MDLIKRFNRRLSEFREGVYIRIGDKKALRFGGISYKILNLTGKTKLRLNRAWWESRLEKGAEVRSPKDSLAYYLHIALAVLQTLLGRF